MKVLFAVSNENISEAIIKRYPKEFKEILSYKNVYYFDAILKEIQRDKSYDRIVISEDLEPFINTNHDSIDNFIFEHLDRISDEAHDNEGKETAIILICSERRSPGSSILNKLFSIGVYNAVMGKDRNLQELCRLINRPRTKKEAKIYYRIDQATYDPVVENEVNEMEIQNILTHFKKLGKNTERYADSFNNIAAQYTDEQLKIIINVLPMKVKAVLESESPKYQSLMGSVASDSNKIKEVKREPGIKVNAIGKGTQVNGPIVIPSNVKKATVRTSVSNTNVQKQVVTPKVATNQTIRPQTVNTQPQTIKQPPVSTSTNQVNQVSSSTQVSSVQNIKTPTVSSQTVKTSVQRSVESNIQKPQIQGVKTNIQRPQVQSQTVSTNVEKSQVQPQAVKPGVQNSQVQHQNISSNNQSDQPQVAKSTTVASSTVTSQRTDVNQTRTVIKETEKVESTNTSDLLNDLNNEVANPISEGPVQTEVKRGRGRPPKKAVAQTEPVKPKGKRGRPPKNPVQVEEILEENILPETSTTEEDLLPGIDEESLEEGVLPETEEILPGIDEEEADILPGMGEEESDVLPGMEEETSDSLPGLDEIEEDELPGLDNVNEMAEDELPELDNFNETEDTELPGIDGVDEEDGSEEVDVSALLSGLDENDEEDLLPGIDEESLEEGVLPETEEILPGIDEEIEMDTLPGTGEEEADILPGMEEETSDSLPGLDEIEDNELPGLDDFDETEEVLPGLDDAISDIDNQEETILPGMGFEDTSENEEVENFKSENTNAVDTVKSQINYSMSNLNSLLSKDKKIVTFIGTTKNGTSFLINNLALIFSLMGIDTAILDMTKNRNSYYIFTNNLEELRKTAYASIGKLENGYADGIKFNKNFTVYTALPDDENNYENAEPILSTLVQNHSLVLIDCDFNTPPAYFASCQEIYLVQSMDILTIQPLTAFIRELKFKNAWEPEKARVVINKETKVRGLNGKMIIAGMSRYNGPDMSVMTDLFNKDMIKACSIPFDEKVYCKYLETMATCKLSLNGYSKPFMQKMQILSEMVYPSLNSKKTYGPMDNNSNISNNNTNTNVFSNSMNNTLNQMKNKY